MTAQETIGAPGKYRLRVADFLLLDQAGTFGDARTELVAGEIIVMSPEYRPHMFVKNELAYRLRRALEELGSDLYVGDGSVRVSDHDMPQPDIVLTSEPHGEGAIPVETVALIVEVSSTTLDTDLGAKAALYAAAGVPEYWVADVNAKMIHQMWAPSDGAYMERRELGLGERIEAATIHGINIPAS